MEPSGVAVTAVATQRPRARRTPPPAPLPHRPAGTGMSHHPTSHLPLLRNRRLLPRSRLALAGAAWSAGRSLRAQRPRPWQPGAPSRPLQRAAKWTQPVPPALLYHSRPAARPPTLSRCTSSQSSSSSPPSSRPCHLLPHRWAAPAPGHLPMVLYPRLRQLRPLCWWYCPSPALSLRGRARRGLPADGGAAAPAVLGCAPRPPAAAAAAPRPRALLHVTRQRTPQQGGRQAGGSERQEVFHACGHAAWMVITPLRARQAGHSGCLGRHLPKRTGKQQQQQESAPCPHDRHPEHAVLAGTSRSTA